MPRPIKFDEQWANEPPQELLLDFLYKLSKDEKAIEDEARALWENHLWECDQGRSTSGMDFEERVEDAQTVGVLFEQDSRFIMFDDIMGALVIMHRTETEIPMPLVPSDVEEEQQ